MNSPASLIAEQAYAALSQHRLDDALPLLEQGIAKFPNDLLLRQLFGRLCLSLQEPCLAMQQFDRILKHLPMSESARAGRAQAYLALGQMQEARRLVAQILSINASSEIGWTLRAQLLEMQNDYVEADRCYDKLVTLAPNHAMHRYHRGLNRLRLGRFASGWQDYEARFDCGAVVCHTPATPRWHGQNSSHILLIAEQGLGDMIQAARWINQVKQQMAQQNSQNTAQPATQITLACPATLASLMARSFAIATVTLDPASWPVHEHHCPLLSLPAVLGLDQSSKQALPAYLSGDPQLQASWQTRLPVRSGKLRVGIAWATSVAHVTEEMPYTQRSCALTDLHPLAQLPDIEWVNLQVGHPHQGKPQPFTDVFHHGIDLSAQLSSLDDTAAVIANLDAVVTVDTALLHLASALGKTTLAMLPITPSWRWTAHTSQPLWYQSLQFFTQQTAGDWQAPIQQIAATLQQMVTAKTTTRKSRQPSLDSLLALS
ncbi:tetratricopeptide repeat protein [Ampullimonas aquatilis]|uniref:tetratricopeptide repeat protein n=1 Tax=Ampullimonas aquatilis TaxID=1341549 RepID=UPI003C7859BB